MKKILAKAIVVIVEAAIEGLAERIKKRISNRRVH